MIHDTSMLAIAIFLAFVGFTLGLSFYLGSRAKSSQGYFAAHGQIPWFINGIAFAGDYLSAASFLGICGMIAFFGYDGFLYSIGYLAGWIVALFVIAEPMKRLGKYTFADVLDANFHSRGIRLAAGISTLVVSIVYLIPQMVGAGALVQPLLNLPHWFGVVLVGTIVIGIVVSAGMVSTTWVQFLKGSLLVLFSAWLTGLILYRGLEVRSGGRDGHEFRNLGPFTAEQLQSGSLTGAGGQLCEVVPASGDWVNAPFVRLRHGSTGPITAWLRDEQSDGRVLLRECQTIATVDAQIWINGAPKGTKRGENELHPVGFLENLPTDAPSTGPLGPIAFLKIFQDSRVVLWQKQEIKSEEGRTIVYFPKSVEGGQVLLPGQSPTFAGIRSGRLVDKLNFLSLMLALFGGTASLPHILIRYYTVKDSSSARKSTIVGIASIGFFYVMTLYIGLGAMTSGALDISDSNMAAPLLARSLSEWLFALISAIAFTTVLGTVSGLIIASSGAVAHDLVSIGAGRSLSDSQKVRVAKIASIAVGAIAIGLGILFREFNVSYLVGWAFCVAASANLPSLILTLFWRGTTKQGIVASVLVGMIGSVGWILLSSDAFTSIYRLPASSAWVPFSQPGIVTIPLGFVTVVVVSMLTRSGRASSASS